jgi:hypothetical protein
MNRNETPAENLRGYLRQLTLPTRARLLAEVERLRQSGEDVPGADIILAELRTNARPDPSPDAPPVDQLEPAARHFFSILDPYLTNRLPERANDGQISRHSLQPLWDWISRDLMASMARAYTGEVKQFAGNRQRELDQAVLAFQNKAVKYLEGTLASATGAEQARARLGKHGGSAASFGDLLKILRILKAREPLAQFEQGMPVRIDRLDGRRLDEVLDALDALAAAKRDAVPFAIVNVVRRLTTPWHLLRLATDATDPEPAAEVAAAPYAFAVVMVLDLLEDQIEVLRAALRKQHVPRAKEILMAIYDTEYAIRSRIDLAGAPWDARLETIMQAVAHALDTEEIKLPAGLTHVLRSPALRNHHSLSGRLTRLAWKCRDAVTGGPAYARNLIASLRNPQA